MHLTAQDANRFWHIKKALQSFNVKKLIKAGRLSREPAWDEQAPWPSRAAIREFVQSNPAKLNARDLALVSTWHRSVEGPFIAYRHLKKYSVFISDSLPRRVYGVVGTRHNLTDILFRRPDSYRARLVPFEGVIACEILHIDEYPVPWTRKNELEHAAIYRKARRAGAIITSLD